MGTFSWVYVLNMFFNWSLWWGQLSLVVALNVCIELSIPVDPPGGSSGKSWGYCLGTIILCCVVTIKSNWIPLSRIGRNHPVITIHQTHDNRANNCGDISPKHWLSGLHWGQFNSIRCTGRTQSCRTVLRLEHYRWGHVLTLPIVSACIAKNCSCQHNTLVIHRHSCLKRKSIQIAGFTFEVTVFLMHIP